MLIESDKDPIGCALLAYFHTADDTSINVKMDIADDDTLAPSYFFRTYEECPELEQLALQQARGKVLDVGAGAGSHALQLQAQGLDVVALDVSPKSVEVMRLRGVKQPILCNFYGFKQGRFDTLMFLMNGIGLVQTLDGFSDLFQHAKTLLSPGGQILLDSSDLIYMFEQEDGSYIIDLNEKYHGEVAFDLSYKGVKGENFNWLYVSEELLQDAAEENGFDCEIIQQGPHYDYLARLTLQVE